ncbi:replication-relaxation family protein [Metabacillus sp. 84]|uniref:replication-relaxation family protein n=1 Tax=Metabacillus sp. 84 TaxID=3404705 RepID=UPI003CEA5BE8
MKTQRDHQILEDLKKFRVLDRNQIIGMHFNERKDPVQSCNKVMKRLARDGVIDVDPTARPYNYFPSPSSIKKNSTKIPHFKAIADFYIELCQTIRPKKFEVEYRTGLKGSIEPDVYMIWNNNPFFVEIQRNIYTKKVMNSKIERYAAYYSDGDWKAKMKHFPYIWIITEHLYDLDPDPLRVFQSKNVEEMIETYMKRKG